MGVNKTGVKAKSGMAADAVTLGRRLLQVRGGAAGRARAVLALPAPNTAPARVPSASALYTARAPSALSRDPSLLRCAPGGARVGRERWRGELVVLACVHTVLAGPRGAACHVLEGWACVGRLRHRGWRTRAPED